MITSPQLEHVISTAMLANLIFQLHFLCHKNKNHLPKSGETRENLVLAALVLLHFYFENIGACLRLQFSIQERVSRQDSKWGRSGDTTPRVRTFRFHLQLAVSTTAYNPGCAAGNTGGAKFSAAWLCRKQGVTSSISWYTAAKSRREPSSLQGTVPSSVLPIHKSPTCYARMG